MAGKFGTFKIAEDTHVSIGNDEVDLAAGEVTPTDEVTAAACRQLCGVSCKRPGDENSWVMAEQTEGPDPAPAEAPEAAGSAEQSSPAASPSPPSPAAAPAAAPAPSLADAEAELAKAQADIAAAQKSENPPA